MQSFLVFNDTSLFLDHVFFVFFWFCSFLLEVCKKQSFLQAHTKSRDVNHFKGPLNGPLDLVELVHVESCVPTS